MLQEYIGNWSCGSSVVMVMMVKLPADPNRYVAKKSKACKICSSWLSENPVRRNPLIVVIFLTDILRIEIVVAAEE